MIEPTPNEVVEAQAALVAACEPWLARLEAERKTARDSGVPPTSFPAPGEETLCLVARDPAGTVSELENTLFWLAVVCVIVGASGFVLLRSLISFVAEGISIYRRNRGLRSGSA